MSGLLQESISPGGMLEQTTPDRAGLVNPPPRLRDRVLGFLKLVEGSPGDNTQVFHDNPSRTDRYIETNGWAVKCMQQIHASADLLRVRQRVVDRFEAFFNPQLGLYEPTEHQAKDANVLRMHNDSTCRLGFEAINVAPRPFPRGIEHLKQFPWALQPGADRDAWLNEQIETGSRRCVKNVYQYLSLYCGLMGIDNARQLDGHARDMFEFLESKRDAETGFFGMTPDANLGFAMRGHRNIALNLHWRLGIPEPAIETMIDHTLACQRDDGLFHDGSMCANMDAVHLLAEYGLRTAHRHGHIVEACRRCCRAMFERLADPTGGFHFELPRKSASHARLTNGTAFVLFTMRHWQGIDSDARRDLGAALDILISRPPQFSSEASSSSGISKFA